jgi:hypothetical protein
LLQKLKKSEKNKKLRQSELDLKERLKRKL